MPQPIDQVVTVTLHTAVDRVIVVPDFVPGQHLRGRTIMDYPAGKGVNVTRALARLGRSSVATGFVGRDDLRRFDELLEGAGPGRAVSQFLGVKGQTRRNLTLLDPVNHTDTHVRDEGFEVSKRDVERMFGKVKLLCRPGTLLVLGGSVPPGMDQHALQRLVGIARQGGAQVVLDAGGPALRPFLDSADDADEASRPFAFLKPNVDEATSLMPDLDPTDEMQLLEVASMLLPIAHAVVVSRGDAGALLACDDGVWRGGAPTASNQIANTVGCGDCMVAGLIDALMAGASWPNVLKRGIAAATANALDEGIAHWSRDKVLEFEKVISVEEVTR